MTILSLSFGSFSLNARENPERYRMLSMQTTFYGGRGRKPTGCCDEVVFLDFSKVCKVYNDVPKLDQIYTKCLPSCHSDFVAVFDQMCAKNGKIFFFDLLKLFRLSPC